MSGDILFTDINIIQTHLLEHWNFQTFPYRVCWKVRDAVVFGRVLLHVKASKKKHLEKMSRKLDIGKFA